MNEVIRRIRYILQLRCDEASRLTSDSLDRPLVVYERIALAGHRLVCRSCRRLKKQLLDIRETCRLGRDADVVAGPDDGLGRESKDRLLAAIRDRKSNDSP